jgi:DNA-binding NarL/FixJ family response regulator
MPGSNLVQLQGPYQQHIQIRQSLTPRQEQILHLLQQGSSNKEIARSLQISHFTVRNHITCIFRTVGVRSRRELQRLAAQDRTRYDAGRHSESHITKGLGTLR